MYARKKRRSASRSDSTCAMAFMMVVWWNGSAAVWIARAIAG